MTSSSLISFFSHKHKEIPQQHSIISPVTLFELKTILPQFGHCILDFPLIFDLG